MKETLKYIPTFDEWYAKNHMGMTFESHYHLPHNTIQTVITGLSKELRNYISEMAQK